MSPFTRSSAALCLLFFAAGCDRLPEAVIVPEFDFTFSFEDGLQGWQAQSAELGNGTVSVEASTDRASAGTRSLRITMDNQGGAAKVWVTRELAVTRHQSYVAELSLALGSADPPAAAPWKVIAGLRPSPPSLAAELPYQDETPAPAGAGGFAWAGRSYTVPVTADAEGRIFLTLGIWGTSPSARTYWMDNVRVVLTRS